MKLEDCLVRNSVQVSKHAQEYMHEMVKRQITENLYKHLAQGIARPSIKHIEHEFYHQFDLEMYVIPPALLWQLVHDEVRRMNLFSPFPKEM